MLRQGPRRLQSSGVLENLTGNATFGNTEASSLSDRTEWQLNAEHLPPNYHKAKLVRLAKGQA